MTVDTRPVSGLAVQPSVRFIETAAVEAITSRALAYLQAGYPLHLRGPAGTGKTTLAMHIAAQIGRPVMLMVGDEEFSTSDLVGAQRGYHYRRVVDRFIHSVVKYEEDATQRWVDNRLTTACREGHTLVYDEFTRSRPEANNIMLMVLEERMLVLPAGTGQPAYLKVHPEFRAIFTSNPQEYAGVHATQDALMDRMVTVDIDYYDGDTEAAIVAMKSGLHPADAARIVAIVRAYRAGGIAEQLPTMRAGLMIARVAAQQHLAISMNDARFVTVCLDVLSGKASGVITREQRVAQREQLLALIAEHAG